jgi:SH3-like domain-containing protein
MKTPFRFEPYYDLIRERLAQGVLVNWIAAEIGANPRSLRRVIARIDNEKKWTLTAVRDMAKSMLRKGEHPDKVIDALRQSRVHARVIVRIVKEVMASVAEERELADSDFLRSEIPDTTGLVRLCEGHYATPRSAELIQAARSER